MVQIVLAGGNTRETVERVAEFDFAEPWRRVIANLVNTAAVLLFVAGLVSQILFLPVTAGLREAFGEVPLLTDAYRSGDGFRSVTLFECVLPTLMGVLMLRESPRPVPPGLARPIRKDG